ncbi:hypothetical protein BJX96DRAFT_144269 [Aspergillus floccosus]
MPCPGRLSRKYAATSLIRMHPVFIPSPWSTNTAAQYPTCIASAPSSLLRPMRNG